MPYVVQLLPLLGVAIGAVVTYAVIAQVIRARWLRERDARWDQARLDAYAAYANIIKQYTQIAIRIAATRGFGASDKPLSPEEGLPMLAELDAERNNRWEAVLLLGDPDTIAAARRWHEVVWKLEWFANGSLRSKTMWDEMWQQAARDRARFYECARRSLGIGGGDAMPESGWERKSLVWQQLRERDRAAQAEEAAEGDPAPEVPAPQSRQQSPHTQAPAQRK